MKKFFQKCFLMFLAMALPMSFVQAESSSFDFQSGYEAAQKAYYAKDYDAALQGFEKLLEVSPNNPAIFYNLGNTHYQKGSLGHARLYYEKAKLQLPRLQILRQNLARLLSELKLPEQNSLEHFLQQTFYFWQNHLTYFEVQIFNLGMGMLVTIVLSWRLLKLQKLFGFASMILLFCYIYFMTGAVIKKMNAEPLRYGVVLTPTAEVKSNYLDQSNALFTLPEGVRVKIIDQQVFNQGAAWFRLELADGQNGWTLQQNLGQI